jgi:hypothetical protein
MRNDIDRLVGQERSADFYGKLLGLEVVSRPGNGGKPSVDRNPANRTSDGDQWYLADPDGTRVQVSANGYQG